MSLAASYGGLGSAGGVGAGAGAGGVALAHSANSAAVRHAGNAGPSAAGASSGGAGPPRSASGLGADVVDKSLLSQRAVRSVRQLPIVCVDLYGDDGGACFAPPATPGVAARPAYVSVGTVGTSVTLRRNDEAAHKAVRRLLSYAETGEGLYQRTLDVALLDENDENAAAANDADTVTLRRPHLLLGARRLHRVREEFLAGRAFPADELSSSSAATGATSDAAAAIRPMDDAHALLSEHGVILQNGSLGEKEVGKEDEEDDFDRVSFRLDLLPSKKKKPLTMLPEEAVSLLLAKARRMVSQDVVYKTQYKPDDVADDEDGDAEHYLEFPVAVAVPAWHMGDAVVEAHLESTLTDRGHTSVYHRSVAALAGASLPHKGAPNKLLVLLQKALEKRRKQAERRTSDDDDADKALVDGEDGWPLVVVIGATREGVEAAACQLHGLRAAPASPIETIKVLTEAAVVKNPEEDADAAVVRVLDRLLDVGVPQHLPEGHRAPLAIVTYGTTEAQERLRKIVVRETRSRFTSDRDDGVVVVDPAPSVLSTAPDAVAAGCCALAAAAHGRVEVDGRPVAMRVRNANPCAIGVRLSYHGRDDGPVKVVFDFDRRVPAGPYEMELSAAECAARIASGDDGGGELDPEEVKKYTGGGKNLAVRDEAASNFRMRVVQKMDRDGDWIPVGDLMSPLVVTKGGDDDDDDEGKRSSDEKKERIAIESSIFSISVGAGGVLTMKLTSDNKSVQQANTSARWSKLRYVLWILFLVCFLGGFLVKSYVEDKVFDRDVKKLLAYYEHVTPHSMNVGDKHRARYLVYKYRNKKAKLWKNLENKYGVPVPDEWPEEDSSEEDEVIELDDEEEDNANEEEDGSRSDL